MNARRIDVFFYGLFMDADVLLDIGVEPIDPRPGYVDGFALRIGRRATLVPTRGARAYGMLFALTHRELDLLYSQPGLEHYVPEAVVAHHLEGALFAALCFNLREPPSPEERNPEYASRLRGVLRELGFPRGYVESIS